LHKSFTSSDFDGVTVIEVGAGTGDNSWFFMKISGFGFLSNSTVLCLLKHSSTANDLSLTQQCLSGLVGLALARVARRIFVTGTSASFKVRFTHWINLMFPY
jgi:hypothetical protein